MRLLRRFVILGISPLLLLVGCMPDSRGFSTAASATSQTLGKPVGNPSATPSATASAAPRSSGAANERTCAGKNSTPGIDVSDYDPGIQWPTVRHTGENFAYIKATEGVDFPNAEFADDWAGTRKNGIYRGAYHYFHPSDDPHAQAQYFLGTVGPLEPDDLPPMLDWEAGDRVSAKKQIKAALAWLHDVEAATGKVPLLYTYPSFWNRLGNPQGFERYPLYVANYDIDCPNIPPPWNNWVFWQTGAGPVAGVPNPLVDLDVFNGSLAQLVQFATTGQY